MSSTYGAYQDSLLGHVSTQTTHHTTNHSKLEDIKTKLDSVITNTGDLELNTDTLEAKIQTTNDTLTDGTQKTLLIGSNDILGNTPHRHLTVDTNGRLLTIPTMTSTNNAIGTTNTKLNAGLPSALSTAGNLKVSIEEGGGGDASASNQSTMISSLSTIEGDTTSIDGKITLTNTAIGTTNTKLNAGLPSALSASGNLKVSIEEGGGDASASNQTTMISSLSTIEGDTTSIDGKITQGEADVAGGGNGLQQILCYGKDQSGNLDPLNVDNNGHLKITLNDISSGITDALPVEDMRSWETIATLDSALVVPNAGNNDSSIVSNNKQTDIYIVQIQCDDITYTDFNAEVLESIDASNFKSTVQITQPMIPAFFIMEKINNLSPNWKVRINNTGASTKNFTIKYVKA